jgi:alpha-tubulin suppressor-like RCC1 family protein
VAVGRNFACAIVADGAVMCWGVNDHGQLGGGTTAASSTTPIYVLP